MRRAHNIGRFDALPAGTICGSGRAFSAPFR